MINTVDDTIKPCEVNIHEEAFQMLKYGGKIIPLENDASMSSPWLAGILNTTAVTTPESKEVVVVRKHGEYCSKSRSGD